VCDSVCTGRVAVVMAEQNLDAVDPFDAADVAATQSLARETLETEIHRQQAALRARREAYVRVFSDHPIAGDAAIVLGDLRRFCRGGQTPWSDDARVHALLTGRNEVYTRITQHMAMNFDDLWEVLNGGQS
jgi:hypothetical protein